MIVGFFKLIFILITLPIWLVVWFFKARAVIRAGRPVYPVSESRSIKIVRVPYAVPTPMGPIPPAPLGLPGSHPIPPPPQ